VPIAQTLTSARRFHVGKNYRDPGKIDKVAAIKILYSARRRLSDFRTKKLERFFVVRKSKPALRFEVLSQSMLNFSVCRARGNSPH